MKNVTNIKNDESFLNQLEETIKELEHKNSDEYFLTRLENIKDIALKKCDLTMPQEKYISIQRALDETGQFSQSGIGSKIAEIVFYFAFIYKIE